MNRPRLWIVLFTLFCFLSSPPLQAKSHSCHHGTGKSRDNFFPDIRFAITPVFTSYNSAISLLGEAGPRNYRINGTFGYIPCDQHRFKVSAEYLIQRLNYHFASGRSHRWMHQFATGTRYQYLFDRGGWVRGLEAGVTYSYAPSRHLEKVHCHSEGATVFRRIAGSWTAGGSLGAVLVPWECGSLNIAANYDYVVYRRHFRSKKHVTGLGGSFDWDQRLWNDFSLRLIGQFRRPFNYVETQLNWFTHLAGGDLMLGLFGSHTFGKDKLPCSSSTGLSLNYSLGVPGCCVSSADCCLEASDNTCCVLDVCDMSAWVSTPAVYMPEVLAIVDEKRLCPKPTAKPIPFILVGLFDTFQLDLRPFFSSPNGLPLTFEAVSLPPDSVLSPSGILSGINLTFTFVPYETVVIAKDRCGTVRQSFTVVYVPAIDI